MLSPVPQTCRAIVSEAFGTMDPQEQLAKSEVQLAHRTHDPLHNEKRTDPFHFGSRFLEADDNVFEFNAWGTRVWQPRYILPSPADYHQIMSNPRRLSINMRKSSTLCKGRILFHRQITVSPC